MKVKLKGVATTRKTLANGKRVTYWYAWRGGPRLEGRPGDAAFVLSYQHAHQVKRLQPPPEQPEEPVMGDLIDKFMASPEFTGKAASTRSEYTRYLGMIRAKFGTMPLRFLAAPVTRGAFKDWRDSMAERPRTADFAWSVLARLCAFGVDRGMIERNPCQRGGRLYTADRTEQIWTEEHLQRLFAVASPEVAAVVCYALWTGQRQGDCLTAKWADIQADKVRVRQTKTGTRILIPIGKTLAATIASMPRIGDTILTNSRGQSWTSSGFRASYRKTMARAGIVDDLHFHDLRGTAITRMAIAGATALQISAVTGHSSKTVDEILRNHYLGGAEHLAEQAIFRLEADTENRRRLQTELQTGSISAAIDGDSNLISELSH